MSSATSKTWSVAASVGGVEGLKDQLGLCRWNHPLRCAEQHLKNNVTSFFPAKDNTCSAFVATKSKGEKGKAKQAEESFRTVMYLSCWGSN